MNIIFTVCNRTNLTNALALGSSVMQFPGYIFYLCWVDTGMISNLPNNIKLLPVADLAIPEWQQMVDTYYDFELLPACRPWFAKHLVTVHQNEDTFTFLAPTVFVFNALDRVFNSHSDLQLTPHISSPLSKSSDLDDKRILNIGMFHSGSWILRKNEESLKFLDWWAIRTVDRAKFDLCNGMCLDQLWLNFALVRIKNADQISCSGWHYGLHSVLNHKLAFSNGQYYVDGKDLISVDFAGLDTFDPIWSDHQPLISKSIHFKNLHTDYKKRLSMFQPYQPQEPTPAYGKIPEIKKDRLLRKNIAGKLRSVTRFIDRF